MFHCQNRASWPHSLWKLKAKVDLKRLMKQLLTPQVKVLEAVGTFSRDYRENRTENEWGTFIDHVSLSSP